MKRCQHQLFRYIYRIWSQFMFTLRRERKRIVQHLDYGWGRISNWWDSVAFIRRIQILQFTPFVVGLFSLQPYRSRSVNEDIDVVIGGSAIYGELFTLFLFLPYLSSIVFALHHDSDGKRSVNRFVYLYIGDELWAKHHNAISKGKRHFGNKSVNTIISHWFWSQ